MRGAANTRAPLRVRTRRPGRRSRSHPPVLVHWVSRVSQIAESAPTNPRHSPHHGDHNTHSSALTGRNLPTRQPRRGSDTLLGTIMMTPVAEREERPVHCVGKRHGRAEPTRNCPAREATPDDWSAKPARPGSFARPPPAGPAQSTSKRSRPKCLNPVRPSKRSTVNMKVPSQGDGGAHRLGAPAVDVVFTAVVCGAFPRPCSRGPRWPGRPVRRRRG